MKVKIVDRNKKSKFDETPGSLQDNEMIEEIFENEKSIGFKAKNGGFPFKGEGAKKKAIEQARKMKSGKWKQDKK